MKAISNKEWICAVSEVHIAFPIQMSYTEEGF